MVVQHSQRKQPQSGDSLHLFRGLFLRQLLRHGANLLLPRMPVLRLLPSINLRSRCLMPLSRFASFSVLGAAGSPWMRRLIASNCSKTQKSTHVALKILNRQTLSAKASRLHFGTYSHADLMNCPPCFDSPRSFYRGRSLASRLCLICLNKNELDGAK